jgi:hypothetical protein
VKSLFNGAKPENVPNMSAEDDLAHEEWTRPRITKLVQ